MQRPNPNNPNPNPIRIRIVMAAATPRAKLQAKYSHQLRNWCVSSQKSRQLKKRDVRSENDSVDKERNRYHLCVDKERNRYHL